MAVYGFSSGDAKRIGKAVRTAERFPPKVSLGTAGHRGAASGVRLMLGTHSTASWSKLSSKTVTVFSGTPSTNGRPTASAYTVVAYNIFANITANSATTNRWVAVSNNGHGWYVIAAEC